MEEESNAGGKLVKMRDLQSVIQSEEARQLEGGSKKSVTHLVDRSCLRPLDLNTEAGTGENDAVVCLEDSKFSNGRCKAVPENNHKSLDGNSLDLNAEVVPSSVNHDFFSKYKDKTEGFLQMRDSSDSGKPTSCLEDDDPLKKWKEMKKNGFMSSTFGCNDIPAAPKKRGRKRKNEAVKQKPEQAKEEQADRFTKMAAPSGLLNGLNPGIINHVRNSKQVHSIIKALVRSEKRENSRQVKLADIDTEQDNLNVSGEHGSCLSYVSSTSSMPESNILPQNQYSHCSSLFSSDNKTEYRSFISEESGFAQQSLSPDFKIHYEDDALALKLAASTKVSESTSCVSNVEPTNGSSVDTLSFKAATAASQWLQLLHQDIKGRLAALSRSKKRVQAVITTELPFLLSKEFPSNQQTDSTSGSSMKAKVELHQSHWSKLFNQMDSTLSEEEKQLESWLSQVNEMMLHCDQGLQHMQLNSILEMQRLGTADMNLRSRFKDPEKEMSVRAAAASIYSTCNFLSSRENVSCC